MNQAEALTLLENSEEIFSAEQVAAAVKNMAKTINEKVGNDFPLVLPVMGGATVFTGMLLPELSFPLEFDYIHLTRYGNKTHGGKLKWRVSPTESVKDRTVLVLDDILDEGETMAEIRDRIMEMGAKQFYSAVLCEKELEITKPLKPDFCGLIVPNRYVFGCGMDVKGYWRNLGSIRAMK